jgi:hypothetical protein
MDEHQKRFKSSDQGPECSSGGSSSGGSSSGGSSSGGSGGSSSGGSGGSSSGGSSSGTRSSGTRTALEKKVCYQVDRYFREDNLSKDVFLQKKMDAERWIAIDSILLCRKMKELLQLFSSDISRSVVQMLCQGSRVVEFSSDLLKIRQKAFSSNDTSSSSGQGQGGCIGCTGSSTRTAQEMRVCAQVELYFREEFLSADKHLKKKMDAERWVAIDLILSFSKMKELLKIFSIKIARLVVQMLCQGSRVVEFSSDLLKIRQKAPSVGSGSSLEPSTLFSPFVPNRTFGVEFEMFLPDSKEQTLEGVQSHLRAAGIECQITAYSMKERVEYWKITKDSSIRPDSCGDLGFELVSPVLLGRHGLARCQRVLSAVSQLGASVNESAGFHVHIGAEDLCSAQVANVAQNFVRYEEGIDLMLPGSRRGHGNPYIMSNLAVFGGSSGEEISSAIRGAAGSMEQLVSLVNPGIPILSAPGSPCVDQRHYKLNLHSYSKHGTVEFRQHSGTVDCTTAEAWICFLLRFVEITSDLPTEGTMTCSRSSSHWCEHGPLPPCFFHDDPDNANYPRLESHEKCANLLLNVIRDEQLVKYYIMHVEELHKQEGHTNHWVCKCKKSFDHWQDLNQHQMQAEPPHCDKWCRGHCTKCSRREGQALGGRAARAVDSKPPA